MNQSAFNKFRFDNFFFVKKKKELIKKDFDNYLKGEKENYLNLIKLTKKFASKI